MSWHKIVSGQAQGLAWDLVRGFLAGGAFFYGLAICLRSWLYEKGIFRCRKLPCPVICVGNVAVGGTGKTPLVIELVKMLRNWGLRVAVLSRGYKRKSSGVLVVHDGKKILETAVRGGDEPVLIAEALGDVPVVVGENRWEAGQKALSLFQPDVLVMDDGFQHRSLKRDLDIVVLRGTEDGPLSCNRLLPRGILREPWSSLQRAHAVVLTHGEEHRHVPAHVPVFTARYVPVGFINLERAKFPLKTWAGKRVIALSGIGHPESFEKSLPQAGLVVSVYRRFPDHHWYTEEDQREIINLLQNAEAVVTTEKDLVRLETLSWGPLAQRIFALQSELKIVHGEQQWQNIIRGVCAAKA